MQCCTKKMATVFGKPMKTSDLFVAALENEGVEYIFALPGEENIDLVESLRTSKIKLVTVRHEQAGGFMAATVGRLTGRCGVALSTLGPGATNFSTAVAYSQLGGFPALFITGQKPILKSKQGAFQIVDIVSLLRPITKYAKQETDGSLVPANVREAFRRAEEERPGAAHIELPEDIAHQEVPAHDAVVYHVDRVRRPIPEGKAINRAVEMIKAARHPLLVIGAGANRKMTSNMLRQLVDSTGLPFCDTQMGKGVIDSRNPRYMGTAAISDGDFIHVCIDHADLIIMVGHDTVEKPPFFMQPQDKRQVIHINYFSAVVDPVYFPQLEVVGDIGNGIWQIKEHLKDWTPTWDLRYFCYVKQEMAKHMAKGADDRSIPMSPPGVVALVRQSVPEDTILCLDNGLYKVWFARQYPAYKPNTLLLDNALATMGAGLPSAIGAKMVRPDHTVVALVGDGGLMMNSQELITAVEQKLHIIVLLLNDNAYGMIKWKSEGVGFEPYGLDLSNPDFVKYAEAYGARGYRITKEGQFEGIMAHCLSTPGVHLVELPIDYSVTDELQVPALKKALAEMLTPAEEFLKEADAAEKEHKKSSDPTPTEKAPASKEQSGGPSKAELEEAKTFPFYLANEAVYANEELLVTDKYTDKVAFKVAVASPQDIDRAIAAAEAAAPKMAAMASYQRKEVLEFCVANFKEKFEDLAMSLCIEAGKPIKDSRGEVQRLIDTFQIAAEEATRMYGEYAPMDLSARTKGFQAVVRQFPIGPCSFVSPFNFPLNLAAHKVAPALAVGCPFVLKPASRTPIGALIIAEVLSRAPHLPKGAFSVLPCSRSGADLFTTDPRFKLLSFTGSPSVGWDMKARAGKKAVVLELGGNAAAVVEDYRSDAELDAIIGKITFGAFYQSGQSCISLQRLLIRQDHYEAVKEKLVPAVAALKSGDPKSEDVFVGPLISEKEAKRIEDWIQEAVSRGAKLLVGGKRHGAVVAATVLENVPSDCHVACDEVFGPVMILDRYASFKDAVAKVNDSKYGLQAGVFTHDMDKAWHAFEHLEVGGVVWNHVPSIRVDAQPYGGVKDSGLGREGVRYAMKDMTEERVLMMAGPGQL
ncbi:probable lactaldehyde dehydrogenase at C-terminar half [Coccomyxa sp. Obi]|nr:probable lactaldehyde dehydrogenase at C-terminar half [Coccomyxa sp. Obi]